MIARIAIAALAVALTAASGTAQASTVPDDGESTAVNIAMIEDAAPIICIQVDEAIANGLDPADFIPSAVDTFAETYSNAVGIDLLAEFLHGVLVGCAAR